MKRLLFLTLTFIFFQERFFVQPSLANQEIDFETLVEDLKSADTSLRTAAPYHPFDNIRIHPTFTLTNSLLRYEDNNQRQKTYPRRGFEVSVGIDMLSPLWRAEMSVGNFGQTQKDNRTFHSRYFDIKFMRIQRTSINWSLFWGAGFSARYLKIQDKETGKQNWETPSYLLRAGLSRALTNQLSFAVESCLYMPLIGDSRDLGSFDLGFRLSTHL